MGRRLRGLGALALLVSVGAQAREPSDQTLVYYNARMALREDRAEEVVKLWLLRNALESGSAQVSPHDGDFHSLTWVALGELGLCPDGLQKDSEGAGLWPVALHNQLVRTLGRRRPSPAVRTFDAFEVDRQQRTVAINDVLGTHELQTLRLARGRCLRPYLALVDARESPLADLRDRQVAARVLRRLLERSRETVDGELVRGTAVIEARLFDLDLQLTALAEREARARARQQAQRGRVLGLSRPSVEALQKSAPTTTLLPASEAARILRDSARWHVSEWMSLSPERRQFLFDHARTHAVDTSAEAALDAIALGILDEVLAQGQGAEVTQWVARATPEEADKRAVWSGDRGAALLALAPASGFRERSLIALHRGVDQLGRGDLSAGLRSLAFALQHAPESAASDAVLQLSRRWLSWLSGRFRLTEDLLVTLAELVPRRDFGLLLDDLLWRAALHADGESYALGRAQPVGRSSAGRHQRFLDALARGDRDALRRELRAGAARSPSEMVRFCEELVRHLEREEEPVRRDHVPTLALIRAELADLSRRSDSTRAQRAAASVDSRILELLDGLDALPEAASAAERAHALAPDGGVFVGSLRLAPTDRLPWPFEVETPAAPSVFAPIELTPVEWRRGDRAEPVFGWRISE